jgi:hypothetical protein
VLGMARATDMTQARKVVVGVLERLARHLGSVASDTSDVQRLLNRLTPEYGDIVCKHFVIGAARSDGEYRMGAQDWLVMLDLTQHLSQETQDTIRTVLVDLLSRSPAIEQALDIVQEIHSDELAAIASHDITKAMLELRPEGYEKHLQSLVSIADDRDSGENLVCLPAVFSLVAQSDELLATTLLEFVSNENVATARKIITDFAAQDFAAQAQSDSESD